MRFNLYTFLSFGIVLFLFTSTTTTFGSVDETETLEEEDQFSSLIFDEIPTRDYEAATRSQDWNDPQLEQVQGDDFNERAIFVHQEDGTYLDDMLFVSAVPAAVHWEGSTRFDSMIISDARIRENGNLIGDHSEYLRKIGAEPDIDLIGHVDPDRKDELAGYFSDVDEVNIVTTSNDVYEGASDIARYYWKNQRDIGTDTAVISYVPRSDGGQELKSVAGGTHYGQFQVQSQINAEQTPWIRFGIEWEDPEADTDYRIGVYDPYALQPNSYSNIGEAGHVNPTDNKLFDHAGYGEIGLSPYYSYMPHSLDDSPQGTNYKQFTGTLPAGDGSIWPLPSGTDHRTFEFGPIKKGDWIAVVTNWTYYSYDETTYRDFNSYIYRPDQEVGPQYHLEVAVNDYNYGVSNRNTPESGYCYADRDGNYSVTIHPFNNSVGGTFHTTVYWGTVDEDSTWSAGIVNNGNDPVDHKFIQYHYLPEDVSESVTNGAVVASLNNAPLMYTAGGAPEKVVLDTLLEIGITNVILIDPGSRINPAGWNNEKLSVTHVSGDIEVFNYIYNISKERGLDRSLVLAAQGGPWFSGAALGGAFHGAPVPALDDDEAKWIQIRSTAMWWQVIQDSTVFQKAPTNKYSNPSQANMEELSEDIFSWLEGFNTEFDPDCGDSDGDGIPDNGKNWDYSDDVDVLVVSPMNALKPIFDRAMSGKASVGRISPAEPEVLWAVLNREMLYWKVGFSQASNPEDPDDSPPVDDHWNRALWTFNTYAHDDDIMDDDAGDQDDDDWCGVDDGGANHLSYKTREDLPSYADASGRISEYHTYYDDIIGSLEGGTILWSNHGHGHAYWMLETGPGFTGTGADPSDPPWGGPVPDNGFVDPPLETTSGWDWYLGLDNVHSSFSTYQSCQVGGSSLSENFLRLGGVGVIGGYVTRSLVEATIQSDRTTKGLFVYNMTFGEAHRWGQDETGNIYSLKDPAVTNRNYQDYGFPDDVEKRYGDTGHTILYGDPSLRILAPTLFISSDISVSESGKDLVVDITVMDQSGIMTDPDALVVYVDGEMVEISKTRNGRYRAEKGIDEFFMQGEVIVEAYDADHLSPDGTHQFKRTYDVHFNAGEILPGSLGYVAGLTQQVISDGPACTVEFHGDGLTMDDINEFTVSVYDPIGEYTGVYSNITLVGSQWIFDELNVSALPEGDYYVEFSFGVKYHPIIKARSIDISVEHEIYFAGGVQNFDPSSKALTFQGLEIKSTYIHDSPVPPEKLLHSTYEIFSYSEVKLTSTGTLGDLNFDDLNGTYGFYGVLVGLPLGEYQFKIRASLPYSQEGILLSEVFSIDVPVRITEPIIRYTGGMEQLVHISGIQFYLSDNDSSILPPDQIRTAICEVLYQDNDPTGSSFAISEKDGTWDPILINVSSLEEGSYRIGIRITTISYGSNIFHSESFTIDHEVMIFGPSIEYDREDHTLDLTGIKVISSYLQAEILPVKMAIKDTSGDVYVDITHSLDQFVDTWQVKDLDVNDILPEGDEYVVEMSFWADGDVEGSISDPFTVSYDLAITVPEVLYEPEYDLLGISAIEVRSEFNGGTLLSPESLLSSSLSFYNSSSDELLLETFLQYSKGRYYQDITKALDKFGEGEIYAIATFSTPLSGNFSVTSDPISIVKPVKENDPEIISPGDTEKDDGVHWAVIVALVLLVLFMIVFFAIIALYMIRSRQVEHVQETGLPAVVQPPGLRPAEKEMMPNLPPPRREALPEVEYLRPTSPGNGGK